jgi:hypothetical protein
VLVTLTEDYEAILRCVRSDDFSLAAGSAGDSTRSRRLASSNVRRTSMRRRRSPLVTTTPVAIKTPMMTGAMRRMTYRPMSTSCGPSSGVSRLARRRGERTLLLMRSQTQLGAGGHGAECFRPGSLSAICDHLLPRWWYATLRLKAVQIQNTSIQTPFSQRLHRPAVIASPTAPSVSMAP